MSQSQITSFFGKRKVADSEDSERDIAGASSEHRVPAVEASVRDKPSVSGDEANTNAEGTSRDTSELQVGSVSDKTCEQNKLKKQKLAQEFNPNWKEGRPWLVYKENRGMYCTLCTKFNKKPFGRGVWNTEPSVRLRKGTIKEHEKSAEHRDSVKLDAAVRQSKNVGVALTAPEQLSTDGMVQAFQCLYFLCKNSIAHTTNFPKLLELEKLLGLDIMEKIKKGKNAKYTSEQAIKEMLICLSELIETNILKEIKKSDSYSLMFDETTDISVTEQMVIHSRFIDGNGDVCIKYLKILDALEFTKSKDKQQQDGDSDTESANDGDESDDDVQTQTDMFELDTDAIQIPVISLNADTICGKVADYIESNDLKYENLRGLGTDGAAVMTGKRNGAVKQIIDRQQDKQKDKHKPSKLTNKAIGAHCAAHKLNLAAKQAGTEFPIVQRFKRVLNQLHAFYSRSAVRNAGLKAVQKLLHESDCPEESGKVANPAETRWLALGDCATKLKNIITSVIISLEREASERADMKAAGLVNLMTRFEFLATLELLCQVLPTINRLSAKFQESKIDFSAVNTSLKATVASLEAKRSKD